MRREHLLLQSIGIVGTERGNGVTHLAIMLGNYITAKLHKNTAVIEMNHTNAFSELKESFGIHVNSEPEFDNFKISNVTYYYNVQKGMIGRIYNKNYEYIIIDMGTDRSCLSEEFLKCNIRIVIGQLNSWKYKKFIHSIENDIAQDCLYKTNYIVNSGIYEDIHQIENDYKISIIKAPFEPDPFFIHGCSFGFLNQLLSK